MSNGLRATPLWVLFVLSSPRLASSVHDDDLKAYGDRGMAPTAFDPFTECPIPREDKCPPNLQQSTLWPVKHLQPCAEGVTNVFVEDPWSEAVLHACGSDSHGALPNTCDDKRLRSIALDESRGNLYVTTGHSVERAKMGNSSSSGGDNSFEALVSGFVSVHLKGFNLGSSRSDLIGFSVKGVECRSVMYYNSTDVACIVGDEKVLSTPLTGACVKVSTKSGGSFSGQVPSEVAFGRKASGTQKPLVYDVQVTDRGFQPTALAVHNGLSAVTMPTTAATSTTAVTSTTTTAAAAAAAVGPVRNTEEAAALASRAAHQNATSSARAYWFNRASGTVQSCRLGDGGDLVEHLKLGVGARVADLEVSADGKSLYLSDANSGRVMRLPTATTVDTAAAAVEYDHGVVEDAATVEVLSHGGEVLSAGLIEPWGLALDEANGFLFVTESGLGRLLRIDLTSSSSTSSRSSSSSSSSSPSSPTTTASSAEPTKQPPLVIASVASHLQLSEVAVLPPPLVPVDTSTLVETTRDGGAVITEKEIVSTLEPEILPARLDLRPRLVWPMPNGDTLSTSTLHGTKQKPVASVPTYAQHRMIQGSGSGSSKTNSSSSVGSGPGLGLAPYLVWPRAVAADRTRPGMIFVAEYLGRVWELDAHLDPTLTSTTTSSSGSGGGEESYREFARESGGGGSVQGIYSATGSSSSSSSSSSSVSGGGKRSHGGFRMVVDSSNHRGSRSSSSSSSDDDGAGSHGGGGGGGAAAQIRAFLAAAAGHDVAAVGHTGGAAADRKSRNGVSAFLRLAA